MNAASVLKLVGERLATIKKSAGFDLDIASVLVGVDEVSEADRYPLLGVLLETEEAAATMAGCPQTPVTGSVLVFGSIEEIESDTAAAPLLLLNNMKRALFNDDAVAALHSKLTDFQYTGCDVLPKLDGDARTEIQLRLSVRWMENLATGT